MDMLEEKIQAVRHICKQLEIIDSELSKTQDIPLVEEYLSEKLRKMEQLRKFLIGWIAFVVISIDSKI